MTFDYSCTYLQVLNLKNNIPPKFVYLYKFGLQGWSYFGTLPCFGTCPICVSKTKIKHVWQTWYISCLEIKENVKKFQNI